MSKVVIKEISKSADRFAWGDTSQEYLRKTGNENDFSTSNNYSLKLSNKTLELQNTLSRSIKKKKEDNPKEFKLPEDTLTYEFLRKSIKPIFEHMAKYAIESYKVTTGDSNFFKERIGNKRTSCFAYNAETDIDKICSLATEYIRHFEFGIGDDTTAEETANVLNEFAEKYIYTYENIITIVDAFKEVIILGLAWLYIKYDYDTTTFSIEVVLPMSIMFSNSGKLSHNNIDWLVHEEILNKQVILNTFCSAPNPSEEDEEMQKLLDKNLFQELKDAMSCSWDGSCVTPIDYISRKRVTIDDTRSSINRTDHFPVLYKYKRFFNEKTRKFYYVKKVLVNKIEIQTLTEVIEYIPYVPFVLKDSYAYAQHAPHRRFQSIVARAEAEIMISSMIMSSIASRCANDISGLIVIDERLLGDKSQDITNIDERSVLKVPNVDPNMNLRDSFITIEGMQVQNLGTDKVREMQDLISSKFFSIVNKDSLFKSGVHYTSVANHQIKVASTTLSILDVTMIGIHAIVKKIIRQTLVRNPSAVFTYDAIKRIKKARQDKLEKNDTTPDDALFGLSPRQMANYALRIIDTLHFVATESAADGSKRKADLMKLYELNTASGNVDVDLIDIAKSMNLSGDILHSMKRKARMRSELQSMQFELQKAQIIASIELEKAKALEQRAKALEHEMKAKQLDNESKYIMVEKNPNKEASKLNKPKKSSSKNK